METLAEATNRLTKAGYVDDFRAEEDGLHSARCACVHRPEELEIDETVRFEGITDPADEAILFALTCKRHGTRGTFVVAYGPSVAPLDAEMVRRLEGRP